MHHRLVRRYRDVLASIYIFNEYRGYSSLDRLLLVLRQMHPDDHEFIAAVEKHRNDERKHYLLFKAWFARNGLAPLAVDKTCAHIDRLIRMIFGCDIDGLEMDRVIASDALFARLCRIIVLTEKRGMRQVDKLLAMSLVTDDRGLNRIFRVIERDEPSHWRPYHAWLTARGEATATLAERIADWWVHRSLILFKLPLLFCNPAVPRRVDWHDAESVPPPPVAPPLPA